MLIHSSSHSVVKSKEMIRVNVVLECPRGLLFATHCPLILSHQRLIGAYSLLYTPQWPSIALDSQRHGKANEGALTNRNTRRGHQVNLLCFRKYSMSCIKTASLWNVNSPLFVFIGQCTTFIRHIDTLNSAPDSGGSVTILLQRWKNSSSTTHWYLSLVFYCVLLIWHAHLFLYFLVVQFF